MQVNNKLQTQITENYYTEADKYESELRNKITEVEKEFWVSDILPAIDFVKDCKALDAGCGTGMLSRMLLEWGCNVVGLDASEYMMNEAVKCLPASFQKKAAFLVGDVHQDDTFSAQTFDIITVRQMVCHLYDPLLVFQNWHKWLKAGGHILMLEGLWFRQDWMTEDLVDRLPLSCYQSRATVSYLLEKSGFQIEVNRWLPNQNGFFTNSDDIKSPHYLIIANTDSGITNR